MRKSLVCLASVAGIVLGSTAAAAAPVGSRDASPAAKSDHLAGVGTFGVLLAVLIAAGTIEVIASDTHHHPASP